MRNFLAECGFSQFEIEDRVINCWNAIFDTNNPEHFYYNSKDDSGYIKDTGNNDARTEGMSYGMMMAVQMNRKDIFDRLWKWARTNMYLSQGFNKGFFCWSNKTDGTKNSDGPAPDGEEYFALSLFFAAEKWGNGNGIFNYTEEARAILRNAIHGQSKMWDLQTKHVLFVCNSSFSDPSYHLPHFYEIFSERCDSDDKEFWKSCAQESRKYLVKSCHPKTGLSPEYAEHDGKPLPVKNHGTFFSDSYRVAANIGLDALWSGFTPELSKIASNIINFFDGKTENELKDYLIDGTPRKKLARHPVGLIATIAQAALAIPPDSDMTKALNAVKRFWNTPMRKGKRRYYDNCLYFFALLALSGKYEKY